MKKLNVMLHTEVIECLRELSDETLAKVMRMIFDWNEGLSVEPKTEVERFAWKMILPKLEANKETYLNIVERNKQNAKNAGRPKKEIQNNPMDYSGNPNIPNPNYNYNSNINSSKEEFINNGKQHSSPQGDDVVSKGLEKLESIFPNKKNYIDIDTVNLWNSFTQDEKQLLIKKATVYIREEQKKNEGTYIKQLSKWLVQQKEKGLSSSMKPLKNNTSNDDPRLFKLVHGQLWSAIEGLTNSSTKADELYKKHNRKDLYSDVKEMWLGIMEDFNQNKN